MVKRSIVWILYGVESFVWCKERVVLVKVLKEFEGVSLLNNELMYCMICNKGEKLVE